MRTTTPSTRTRTYLNFDYSGGSLYDLRHVRILGGLLAEEFPAPENRAGLEVPLSRIAKSCDSFRKAHKK